MNELHTNGRTLLSGLSVAGLATFVCLASLWAVGLPGVDNDLTQVLTVARNIANGDGLVTDTLYYAEHYATGEVPAPQTVFPPGQPFVIAVMMKFGLDEMTAAHVVSGIGFVVIPVCLFLICLRLGVRNDAAVGTAILWLCVVLAWANTVGRKSDIPFTALTMVSACFLVRAGKKPIRDAFIAGGFAAAALTFRYAGLFFMTAVGLTLLIDWVIKRTRLQFNVLASFCAPAGATALLLFWRNYSIVGDIKGGNNYAVDKSLTDIARSIYRAISALTGLDYARLPEGGIAEWTLIGAVLAGCLLLVRYNPQHLVRSGFRKLGHNRGILLCTVYPLFTLLMLFVLEQKSQPGSRDRMYLVAVPFLFCLLASLFQAGPRTQTGHSRTLFRVFVGAAVIAFIMGQANVARARFAALRHEHHWYRMQAMLSLPMEGSTVRRFLEARITREHPLLVNEPQRAGELLKRPVCGLPSYLYSPKKWTASEVKQIVDRYNIEYVLVFTDVDSLEFEDVEFFREIVSGNVPDWMVPRFQTDAIHVYRIRR